MALWGIQEYIARDVNNIARVAMLLASRAIYSCIPGKMPSNTINIIYIGLCVSSTL